MDPLQLDRLRAIALALPDTSEGITVHHPSFKLRKTAFVICTDHDPEGVMAIWCKSTLDEQRVLIAHDPDRFFAPPYLGPRGWVGVTLREPVDWMEVAEIVEDAYRLVATKRQLADLDARSD